MFLKLGKEVNVIASTMESIDAADVIENLKNYGGSLNRVVILESFFKGYIL